MIVVDQFKAPTLIARRRDNPATTDGWITEAVAGMIDPGETAEEAIIREALEETGYRIANRNRSARSSPLQAAPRNAFFSTFPR